MVRRLSRRTSKSTQQDVRNFPATLLARQIPRVRPSPWPGFIEPSLATLQHRPPAGDLWVHEIKYDGYRLQLHLRDGRAQFFTRRGNDRTEWFEGLAVAAIAIRAHAAILDG